MKLSTLFVPMMAYVQGLDRQPSPDPAFVHEQLQTLIKSARDQAIAHSVDLQRFHDALFPVVAWIDERLALLPDWHAAKAWRAFMLQRKLFATSLAGVQFFERLDALDLNDEELREVYVMCLALGFVGRYSQNPNSPELVALRQANYQLLRPEVAAGSTNGVLHLFPEAYRLVTGSGSGRRRHISSKAVWLLVVLVPVVLLVGMAFWFDNLLGEQVNEITRRLM